MSSPTPTPDPDSNASPGVPAVAPAPAPPGTAPAPATAPRAGADSRNRRALVLLAFCAAGLLLLLFAFFSVFFNRRPDLNKRAAQVRDAAGQTGGSSPSILQRPVSTEVAGFTAARPARADAPTPAPTPRAVPPPVAPPEFMPPPSIPAAFSVGAARRGGGGTSAGGSGRGTTARPAAVRGVVPSYQVIPCKLVGALENSGNPSGAGGSGARAGASGQTSSIKALVDEDIRTWDTHEVIIPKGTQCNAVGNFQRGRDRVFVEGDFTFILPGRGHGQAPLELVLPGIAQDRAYDAQVDSWGVTDLSDGIRGDYLETRNLNELKTFAYKFLSGVSGALSATSASSFGQSFSNGATSAATGLPGFVINPAVGGSQAVLDREAERIAAKIEADGYFLRVPAHKQFYVYVTRGFSLRDAKNPVEAAELREQREESRLRVRDERRARQRAAELGGGADPTGAGGLAGDPTLAALLNPAGVLSAAGLRRPPALPTPNPVTVRRTGNLDPAATPSADESAPLPVP